MSKRSRLERRAAPTLHPLLQPEEAKRQKAHRAEVVSELNEELKRHRNWDAKAKWAITLLASPRTAKYLSISPPEALP